MSKNPVPNEAVNEAVEETVLETPAQEIFNKPAKLGGKSIYVMVIEGDNRGTSFDITGIGTYTIGRNDSDVILNDEKVSRKHASITVAGAGQYTITDLASRNGTFVNGIRLSHRSLRHNDLIRIGSTTLRFTVFDRPVPVMR